LAAYQWMCVSGWGGSAGLARTPDAGAVSGTRGALAGGSSGESLTAKKSVCDALNRLSENGLSVAEKSKVRRGQDATGVAGNTTWVSSAAPDKKSADDRAYCSEPHRAARSSSDGDAACTGVCKQKTTHCRRLKKTFCFNDHPTAPSGSPGGAGVAEILTMGGLVSTILAYPRGLMQPHFRTFTSSKRGGSHVDSIAGGCDLPPAAAM
jgi:hypothetical protein